MEPHLDRRGIHGQVCSAMPRSQFWQTRKRCLTPFPSLSLPSAFRAERVAGADPRPSDASFADEMEPFTKLECARTCLLSDVPLEHVWVVPCDALCS